MAIEFKSTRVVFDSTAGITQIETGFVTFSGRVVKAQAAIKGFHVQFDNGDHHVSQQSVVVKDLAWEGSTVKFKVEFLLRDSSGNIDDPYSGYVDVFVIAETGSKQ